MSGDLNISGLFVGISSFTNLLQVHVVDVLVLVHEEVLVLVLNLHTLVDFTINLNDLLFTKHVALVDCLSLAVINHELPDYRVLLQQT